MKIIIDTDPGIDDALALFYAFGCGRFEILGLTAVFGNVTVDQATENAIWLCEVSGQGQIPVARGCAAPKSPITHHPTVAVHGPNGFGALSRREVRGKALAEDAADFLIRQTREAPGEVVVVALGPLTNIAEALQRDPGFADRIAHLYIMGGAFRAPGNVTRFAEANIHNDPMSADLVARGIAKATWVGLDVTDKIVLSPADLAALCAPGTETCRFIAAISDYYLKFYASVGKTDGAGLHDPVTLIACLMPELFDLPTGDLTVTHDGAERGRTNWTPSAHPLRVSTGADGSAVRAEFLSVLTEWLKTRP